MRKNPRKENVAHALSSGEFSPPPPCCEVNSDGNHAKTYSMCSYSVCTSSC